MGNDGGSIPRRDELVKQKKNKEKKDKDIELAGKWRYCAFSSEKLRKPIVSCPLGRLYNKESIIEYLLNKDEYKSNETVNHIRNLKDIKELNLTEKKSSIKDDKLTKLTESNFICPVVGLEMNGNYRFSYLKQCGCVISERALKEIKSDVCLKCNKEFNKEDLIPINGTDDEIKELRIKLEESRSKSKNGKKRKLDEEDNKSIKSNKLTVKTSTKLLLPDKAKDNYSIANDPNASENFKSLFSSHSSAKNQANQNWVTFNPHYNR